MIHKKMGLKKKNQKINTRDRNKMKESSDHHQKVLFFPQVMFHWIFEIWLFGGMFNFSGDI